jgi:hypothetical protein
MGPTEGGHNTEAAHRGTDHRPAQGCSSGHWDPGALPQALLKPMVAEHAPDIRCAEDAHRKKSGNGQGEARCGLVGERFGLSGRRVCRLVTLDRDTLQYRSRRQEDPALQTQIREIAETKRRYVGEYRSRFNRCHDVSRVFHRVPVVVCALTLPVKLCAFC